MPFVVVVFVSWQYLQSWATDFLVERELTNICSVFIFHSLFLALA